MAMVAVQKLVVVIVGESGMKREATYQFPIGCQLAKRAARRLESIIFGEGGMKGETTYKMNQRSCLRLEDRLDAFLLEVHERGFEGCPYFLPKDASE